MSKNTALAKAKAKAAAIQKASRNRIARLKESNAVVMTTRATESLVGAGAAGVLDGSFGEIEVPFIEVEVPASALAAVALGGLGIATDLPDLTAAAHGMACGALYSVAREQTEKMWSDSGADDS